MASFGGKNKDWKAEYLDSDDKSRVRLVGVEFEGKVKPQNRIPEKYKFFNDKFVEKYIEEELHLSRTDTEFYQHYETERQKFINKNLEELGVGYGGWGYDGGGKEIVSLPDSFTKFEKGGSERFVNLVNLVNGAMSPDEQSGTHIHVSKLESDVKTTYENIYWFCMAFAPQIQKVFGRISHWAKTPLPPDFFEKYGETNKKLYEVPKIRPEVRNVYNKGSMVVNRGDRYEFRGPKATNDLEEVLAWIEFCHNIVEVCAKGYIQEVPFADVLRGKYIRKYINKISKENKERAISAKERAMRINSVGYVVVQDISKVL